MTTPLPRHNPRRWLLIWSIALALGTVAVFSGALRNGFVDYDDGEYVTDNPHLRAGFTWTALRWAFTPGGSSSWHPLTWCSHLLDWTLFGGELAGHHLTSVIWHAGASVLALVVLWRLSGKMAGGLFAAAWWAWHPLRAESVAWVSERKDVMCVFFGLVAIWSYTVFVQREQAGDRGARRWFWLCVLATAAGLLSKAMLVTLPVLLCILDAWPLRRWSGAAIVSSPGSGRSAVVLVLEKWPLWLLAAGTGALTYFAQDQVGAVSSDWSLSARLANALTALPSYLGDLFWPRNLAAFYPHPENVSLPAVLASAGLVVAVTAAAWRWRTSRPWCIVGWAWFVVSWLPVSGIVQVGMQARADRFVYLPSLGLALILAIECDRWLTAPGTRRWATAAAAGLLVALIANTRSQVRTWKDSLALFGHATEVTTGNYYAHYALGRAYDHIGLGDRARHSYEEALRIFPTFAPAHLYLGLQLSKTGREADAIAHYQAVLQRNPSDANTHLVMGEVLARLGRNEEAIGSYRRAIECNARLWEANFQLGRLYASTNRVEDAMRAYEAELRLQPDYADAHNCLGNLLAQTGRMQEALAHYETALKIRPGFAEVWANAGLLLWQAGRREEGLAHLRRALFYGPNLPGLAAAFERAERELGGGAR